MAAKFRLPRPVLIKKELLAPVCIVFQIFLYLKLLTDRRKQLLFLRKPLFPSQEALGHQRPRRLTATALAPSSRASRARAVSPSVGIGAAPVVMVTALIVTV